MLGSAILMLRMLRFIVPLLTVALVAGCGGSDESGGSGDRANASSDVNALLSKTFSNMEKMKSATVDLKVQIDPRGGSAASTGPVSARLSGPFESQGENKLPKIAFTADLSAAGQSFKGGVTWTGEKAYIDLQGTAYEVSDMIMKQFIAGYEQALKQQNSSNQNGNQLLNSLGIDPQGWIKDARNEGEAKVGDIDTVKLTGSADVKQVIADLDKLTEKAGTLNVPGSGSSRVQKLTEEQKREVEQAIKRLDIEVYTGAEDSILRRLVVNADLKDAGDQIDAAIVFDLVFTKVGEEQKFEAPANARPFSELLSALDAAGLADLGLGGGARSGGGQGSGGGSATPNNVDKYADCIKQAKTDDEARKCASLLSAG
jgi:hypothetical protein